MESSAERSRARVKALRRLADDHALGPDARTTAGEHLGAALSEPERLGTWCAVTWTFPAYAGASSPARYTRFRSPRRDIPQASL